MSRFVIIKKPFTNEPKFSGISNRVNDEDDLTRVGFILQQIGEVLLVGTVGSWIGDRVWIDEINPFHDASISDEDAGMFEGDEGSGGFVWLLQDPLLEVSKHIWGLVGRAGAKLFEVSIFLTIIGCLLKNTTGNLEMGFSTDGGLSGNKSLTLPKNNKTLKVGSTVLSHFASKDKIGNGSGELL